MSHSKAPTLDYTSLERISCPPPVDKLSWVTEQCRDKFVLDLGAYDETAIGAKEGTPWWVHGRIAGVARRVVGVDNSESIPEEGVQTSERSVIVRADVLDLTRFDLDERPDVVLAGELIEHLPDPVRFLRAIVQDPRLAGATIILTTPNAACCYNALAGLVGRESTHRDHIAIHSYKTLNTICLRSGLRDWKLIPYYTRFPEMALTTTGTLRLGVVSFQRFVNVVERRFPLVAGGWIVAASASTQTTRSGDVLLRMGVA